MIEMRGRNIVRATGGASLIDDNRGKSRNETLREETATQCMKILITKPPIKMSVTVLQRNSGFISIVAFSSTILVTWEAVGRSAFSLTVLT